MWELSSSLPAPVLFLLKAECFDGKAAILGGRGEGAPQARQELQREHPGARIYGLGNTLRRIRDETLQVQSVAEARTSSRRPWDVH